MRSSLVAPLAALLSGSVALSAHADPIEPITTGAYCRVKSPGPQMHFTAGLPFRILADGYDPDGWSRAPCGRSVPREIRFFVDGVSVGVVPETCDEVNHFELRLPAGLTAGPHTLTVASLVESGAVVEGLVPVEIVVDPMPTRASTMTLTADVVLSGDADLDWRDVVVIGNGHTVTAAAGWTGDVIVRDAFVTGLGAWDEPGLALSTSGSVTVERTVFEATGPISLAGGADVVVTGSELRANDLVTYVASDPDRPVVLALEASAAGVHVFSANNVGGGIVTLRGDGWLVGGDDDAASNVLLGPRAVLTFERANGAIVRGNYLHHDYRGGWSQGFNLRFDGRSDDALVEHNVIRDGSWPVQSFGGELRYNLLVNSGHDFVRSAMPGAHFHHNVLVHSTVPDTHFAGAFFFYDGETGIVIEHNTIDGGGEIGGFDAPIVLVDGESFVERFASNAITGISEVRDVKGGALVSSSGTAFPRVGSADHNCFDVPLAPSTEHYLPGIVRDAAGAGDVVGDCGVIAGNDLPYAQAEGDVWSRRSFVSRILAAYRMRFTPSAGSGLVDAGDPPGSDIGAIEAPEGTPRPEDLFGRFGSRTDLVPPTVTLTAPVDGATLAGTAHLAAEASDDVGVVVVQFLAGTRLLGETSAAPYALDVDACLVLEGPVSLTARAWDADGNSATSAAVAAMVTHPGGCAALDAGAPDAAGTDGGPDVGPSGAASCGCRASSPSRPRALLGLVLAVVAAAGVRQSSCGMRSRGPRK